MMFLYQKNNEKMNLLKNIKIRIFIIGVVLTMLSFFIDQYFVNLMLLLQNSFLISLFELITLIGNTEVFVPLAIVMTIYFFAKKKKLLGLWASIISIGALSYLLKIFINRPRPYEMQNISSLINVSLSSFPSGHSMIVFSIVPFLVKNFSKQKHYFWAIALLVAFSRIYLNVHYLSDIVAGAFLGYLIGSIFSELEDKYKWK
jgi:undecaprenyl-diphosphatase